MDLPPTRSHETYAINFGCYQLATGRKLRCSTMIDTFSRLSPTLEPRFAFCGVDVVEVPAGQDLRVRAAPVRRAMHLPALGQSSLPYLPAVFCGDVFDLR